MDYNQDAVKFNLGDEVCWYNEDGMQKGIINIIDSYGVEVLLHEENVWIPFTAIIQKTNDAHMTNDQAHETIAIEQTKIFLLNIVPMDELPNEYVQEIVSAYRHGELTEAEAMQDLEMLHEELKAMVNVNKFLNGMFDEDCLD